MPDWSQLPEELLHFISTHLENCFDVVHARSVCILWRSSFPFPSCLLRPSYYLPTFPKFPLEVEDLCTIEKVPLFHVRVLAPAPTAVDYFLGGICRDESEDHMEFTSPLQCSVKLKIQGSVPTLMKMLDCQVLPLGHEYRIIGLEPKKYESVAFLPLNKERGGGGGGGEFVVILNCHTKLMVLTSAEMRWKRLDHVPKCYCFSLVIFNGRFYATFISGQNVVIDPYSLEVTLLMPSPQSIVNHLYPSGNDELFLVETISPTVRDIIDVPFRVSRLDEESGKWVEVSDLGDRLLFFATRGNTYYSAKDLPHGCVLTGNSFVLTNLSHNETFAYIYGVHTGNAEDDLNCWRASRENRLMKLKTFFPGVALRVER